MRRVGLAIGACAGLLLAACSATSPTGAPGSATTSSSSSPTSSELPSTTSSSPPSSGITWHVAANSDPGLTVAAVEYASGQFLAHGSLDWAAVLAADPAATSPAGFAHPSVGDVNVKVRLYDASAADVTELPSSSGTEVREDSSSTWQVDAYAYPFAAATAWLGVYASGSSQVPDHDRPGEARSTRPCEPPEPERRHQVPRYVQTLGVTSTLGALRRPRRPGLPPPGARTP